MSRVTELSGEESGREERAKLSWWGRVTSFYGDVKLELRKTTWPTRNEVWSTTVIVIIAVIFFGFYLWGVDHLVTIGFEALEKSIR